MTTSPDAPLNVLHVVDSLEYGGLERLVLDLSTRQLAQGYQVAVFSILKTGGYLEDVEKAGIPVIQAGKSRGFDLHVLSQLRKAAASVDIVHAHNFTPNYYSATALLGLGLRGPTLVGTCHDMGDRLSNRRLRIIYQWALNRTTRVSMVSQGVYDQYMKSAMIGPDRAETVLNSVPVERFANTSERRAKARATLGLPEDALVIGNVARHVGFKNQRMLIAAAPALLARFPTLRMVIVGYGELEDTLRQQVRDLGLEGTVMITGKRTDVADILPAFDVYCVPSFTEGLPIALLEACASSLAVVATDVGGNAEVIHHERTGLVIPPGDPSALEGALARMLADPVLRATLASQACTWVRENASIGVLFDKYDRFYRRAIAEHAQR